MTEPRPLERGMLLLDPETYSTPHLWTVIRVNKASAVVIAHFGTCNAEATLRTASVPEGWALLANTETAALAAAAFDDAGHPSPAPMSKKEPSP